MRDTTATDARASRHDWTQVGERYCGGRLTLATALPPR